MGVVEALLVFTVTAFHLAVMPGCIRTDQLVLNTLEFQCFFKHRFALAATAMGKSIREFEAVICLDTLDPDTFFPELSNYSAQELIRGIGALFRVSPKDPVTGILINGSVLKQAQFRIRNTLAGNDFHIDLDPFSGVGHLMVGLWFIGVFLLLCDEPFALQYPVE